MAEGNFMRRYATEDLNRNNRQTAHSDGPSDHLLSPASPLSPSSRIAGRRSTSPSFRLGKARAQKKHPVFPAYQLVGNSDSLPIFELVNGDSDEETHAQDVCRITSRKMHEIGSDLLASLRFHLFMAGLIIMNALVIGLETDNADLPIWGVMENMFLAAFVFELFLRLYVLGVRTYFDFHHADFFWNIFDVFIVSLGAFDVASDLLPVHYMESSNGLPTLFRLLRLLRILRIFRIVRYLRELYMLTFGFAAAAMAIKNITILMVLMLYVCSIVLVRSVTSLPASSPHYEFLQRRFGHISASMLTLFELMSQPDLNPYHDIMRDHPLIAVFLIAFVIWGSLGMIALLTGVISETMFDKNELRVEAERIERENKRKVLISKCEKIFNKLELNEQGEASHDAVLSLVPALFEVFESEGVAFAHHDLEGIISFMDTNQSGSIDKEEFFHGILQIADGVRPMSIMELHYTVSALKSKLERSEMVLLQVQQELSESFMWVRRMSSAVQSLDKYVHDVINSKLNSLELTATELVTKDSLASSLNRTVDQINCKLNGLEHSTKHLVTEDFLTHSLNGIIDQIKESAHAACTSQHDSSPPEPHCGQLMCNHTTLIQQEMKQQDDLTSVIAQMHKDIVTDIEPSTGCFTHGDTTATFAPEVVSQDDNAKLSPDAVRPVGTQGNSLKQVCASIHEVNVGNTAEVFPHSARMAHSGKHDFDPGSQSNRA